MITEVDTLPDQTSYNDLFDSGQPFSSTFMMFYDGQLIAVTPAQYLEKLQILAENEETQRSRQSPHNTDRSPEQQAFIQQMEERRAEDRRQHAQHPNMPNFCQECNRYYEFEASYPVELLIQRTPVSLGDYTFSVGDTAYICSRCHAEIGQCDYWTVVKIHRFLPPM